MAQALQLAAAGRYSTHPNPRVGCVIVKAGVMIGAGAHLKAGEPHAEVFALRQAGEQARGAEVFVTLEPCNHQGRTPPCVDALIAAGVAKVWTAMVDPNPLVEGQGLKRLQAAGIATDVGLLQADAERLNRGFLTRMRFARPFVTLKLGASLDGRTGTASGESQWITSAAARADVHRLRAEAGAVLTSSATVLADNASLTVRDFECEGLRQPDRVVLDSQAQVPTTAKVWAAGARRFWLTGLTPKVVPADVVHLAIERDASGSISLAQALQALARQQVNQLLVECGARLAGALLTARLVDELVLYVAPSFIGHEGRALALLPGLTRLDQRLQLQFTDVRQIGSDLRINAILKDS